MKKFHNFIYGRRFTPLKDQKPLLLIFDSKNCVPIHSASRLLHRALMLLGFDFEIKYHISIHFSQADELSCLLNSPCLPDEEDVIAIVTVENDVRLVLSSCFRYTAVTADDEHQETANDEILSKANKFVKST